MNGRIILTKAFDAESVCRIIEVCSKSGVREFAGYGLKVSFVEVAKVVDQTPLYIPEEVRRTSDTQARESLKQEEAEFKDDALEQMVIEDPARFEELIRSGDLDEKA